MPYLRQHVLLQTINTCIYSQLLPLPVGHLEQWLSYVKPLSHQTAMPQRLYSVLKPCQCAVGSSRNTPKMSNLSVIACTQRPHSVPTASTRRSQSVFTASMTFSRRASSCCSVFTARTRRAYSVLTARTQRPHGDYSV